MKIILILMTICLSLYSNNADASIIAKVGQNVGKDLGPCECAVFPAKEVGEEEKPVIQQSPMNVTCPDDGTCSDMCNALALAAKATGPSLLCARVGHIDNLYASIYSRSCHQKKWEYTGLSCPEPICCHEKAPISCKIETGKNLGKAGEANTLAEEDKKSAEGGHQQANLQ